MSRSRLIGLSALALLVVFALGFFPQWLRARGLAGELRQTRHELRMARLEGVLGAALAESLRGNYERSRQLMADFFPRLQEAAKGVEDAKQRRELEAVLAQRDEVITLLSRAQPESTQRLMLIYTRYFAAVDPAAKSAPNAVTPSPPTPHTP
jgi:Tfp pilus assembly protein FimT